MPDTPPIQGPAQPLEPRRQERTTADAEKFKQEMIRQRSQVGETDPEQEKKRKQQAEEEDSATKSAAAAPAPEEPATPAPFTSAPGGGPAISAPLPPSSSGPTGSSLPVGPPTGAEGTGPTAPSAPSSGEQHGASSQKEGDKSSTQKSTAEPSALTPSSGTPRTAGAFEAESIESGAALPLSTEPHPGPIKASAEEALGSVAETEPLRPSKHHGKKHPSGIEAKHPTEKVAPPPPALSFEAAMETGEVPPPPTPYLRLSLPMLNLFERMVGSMVVMTDRNVSETTFTLNAPQFKSSIFYGTQITIREYTSAPKVFNIQLASNPAAVDIFRGNADALMAAFQYGNYTFRVNRLDTSLLSERPLFHRKGKVSDDTSDQHETGP